MIPPVRTFSRAIETDFTNDDLLDPGLREWWTNTKTNLHRMTDRIDDLEKGETIAEGVQQQITAVDPSGNAADLFDITSDSYENARQDFLSALHD